MPVRPSDVCQFLDRSGWSQARLAWELGINQPRISRFITGMKRPNRELERVLEVFFAEDPRAGKSLRRNRTALRNTDGSGSGLP
ncbi:helix-turn-helix domain-containing protein [Methylobacterium sp. M6A4_1b]